MRHQGSWEDILKAAPQITLRLLHRNLMMVLPKPKHVATILKQSNS
jgi:hypothetical protein